MIRSSTIATRNSDGIGAESPRKRWTSMPEPRSATSGLTAPGGISPQALSVAPSGAAFTGRPKELRPQATILPHGVSTPSRRARPARSRHPSPGIVLYFRVGALDEALARVQRRLRPHD